jgi:Myb-like DNA-binding protein FlbD
LISQSMPHHGEHHLSPYHESRNTPTHSSYGVKLPQPPRYEPYHGQRPQPLELSAYGQSTRARGFETPMPSPSGYSSFSADGAPSLITDTGSESRSPHGAASPLDITLAPLVGARDERKNSSTRYLPSTGFAVEDDAHYDACRPRGSLQLPPLHHRAEAHAPVSAFREPNYVHEHQYQRPQLLTQPTTQHVHHHSMPQPSPLSIPQRALPSFQTLTEPVLPLPSTSSAAPSPTARQLPSPYNRPATEARCAPVSPKDKMSLKNIM